MKYRACLCAIAVAACAFAAPLAAQEQVPPPPAAPAAATPVDTTRQAGPRVRAELQTVRPTFSASRASSAPQNHTFTISTLALVLVVIIVVLLVS